MTIEYSIRPATKSNPFRLSIITIERDFGHPVHGMNYAQSSWDAMELQSKDKSDLDILIRQAESKSWQVCAVGGDEESVFTAFLFRSAENDSKTMAIKPSEQLSFI